METNTDQNEIEAPKSFSIKDRHKQDLFPDEFLKDLNAKQAVIRCGFQTENPGQVGHYLLSLPHICSKIQEALDARSKRTAITKDRVLQEMARVAFADQASFATWGGGKVTLKDSSDLSPDDTVCVKKITEKTDNKGAKTLEIELHDKMKALEMLGRHLVLFTDKLDVNANVQVGGVLRVPTQSEGDWEKEHGEG